MEWLLAKAADMDNVDLDHIGAFGLSYGTMPITMLPARNPAIDCLVSHDGSIAWARTRVRPPDAGSPGPKAPTVRIVHPRPIASVPGPAPPRRNPGR
ncbi:MAG: hypothetical protein ACOCZE_09690, partial [Planctomycetota bacterium]